MTLRIAVLAGIVIVLVVAACGDGDSTETLTLEAYFSELAGIIDVFDDEVDARNEENAPYSRR